MDSNHLVRLPTTIKGLTSIQRCNFGNNALQYLPSELGFLTTLTELRVDNNPLTFPAPHEVRKGLKEILWVCRKQHDYETRGKPPEVSILKQGIGNEVHVPDKKHQVSESVSELSE